VSSQPTRAGRRLAALLGLAALLVGVGLLAAAAGAFLVSKCGESGEAQAGRLALGVDTGTDRPRTAAEPRREKRVAPPIRVEIPSIGVRAPIIRLGLNPNRTLEVPTDFGDAGWWSGGPRPGEPGPAVIVGHIDSYTGPAVFYRLRELRPHATIVVIRRDGTRARFSVIGSEQYPKDHFPTARVYGATAGPTLRLITCGGEFDRSSGHYLDNTVVYAHAA
jgi:Sortase domain